MDSLIQTSATFAHNSMAPNIPVSPTFGVGGAMYIHQEQEQQQQQMQMLPPQLSRSKSLNDITNDSQISAFASDRFINLFQNQNQINGTDPNINNNNNNNNNCSPVFGETINPYGGDNTQHQHFQQAHNRPYQESHQNTSLTNQTILTHNNQYMPMESPFNVYSNLNSQQQQQQQLTRNFNDNQCSNINNSNISSSCNNSNGIGKPFEITTTTATNSTNMFDLCNPLAINLNGVTEQIGNLHL